MKRVPYIITVMADPIIISTDNLSIPMLFSKVRGPTNRVKILHYKRIMKLSTRFSMKLRNPLSISNISWQSFSFDFTKLVRGPLANIVHKNFPTDIITLDSKSPFFMTIWSISHLAPNKWNLHGNHLPDHLNSETIFHRYCNTTTRWWTSIDFH